MALYICVGAFFALFFQYINIYFPDVLQGDFGYRAKSTLRWPLSILVIIFPFYLWLTRFLQKDLEKNPEKKEMKTRKWLLHFTLFAATLVIAGDLIALIFNFLSGGLTVPFILKVLTILVISLTVFLYYGWSLKKEIPPSRHPQMKLFVRAVAGIGIVSILLGFFVAGSPFEERMRQFDERRVNDLSSIQWQIVNFWQSKERLPTDLDELRDDIRGFIPSVDPETGESYEYRVLDAQEFELCATFKTSTIGDTSRIAIRSPLKALEGADSWLHEEGRQCFERSIDPEFFPPFRTRR